jgi:NAD(P)-dependent dehydrogenase (short-subunit alcohol dehydrogenase family)
MSTENDQQEVNVVLGASGGIGSSLCRTLAKRGSRLLLAARASDRLQDLSKELGAPCMPLDARDPEQFERCLESAEAEHGHVTGVTNCIGSLLLKPAHRTSADEWDTTVTLNLGSAFATVRAASQKMRRSGGSVVLVSSAAALTGLPSHEAIAAAKAGIVGLTRSAAASYATSGLRFNAVAPGLVRTKMTEQIWSNETAAAGSVAMHPLGRLGEPEDIASLIAWLLQPANDWVTGQIIAADGGLAHVRGRVKR